MMYLPLIQLHLKYKDVTRFLPNKWSKEIQRDGNLLNTSNYSAYICQEVEEWYMLLGERDL